jgi:Holliday junction resolvase RusA-like endonuclease
MDAPRMEPYIQFFVPGIPAPGGSKRGFYNKKLGRVLMVPASNKTKPWMVQVSAFALEAMQRQNKATMLGLPILLWIEFKLLRPQCHFRTGQHKGKLKPRAPRFSTSKPDLTKLVRSTEDACTGILWHDDSQVAMHNLTKRYCDPGEVPGASIKVFLLR